MKNDKKEDLALEGFSFFTGYTRFTSPDYAIFNEKTRYLTFSGALVDKLKIEDWGDAILAFNKKTKTIAIKRSEPEEYGSRRFSSINEECRTKVISLKGFVRFFNLESSRLYIPTRRAENLLILEPHASETDVVE